MRLILAELSRTDAAAAAATADADATVPGGGDDSDMGWAKVIPQVKWEEFLFNQTDRTMPRSRVNQSTNCWLLFYNGSGLSYRALKKKTKEPAVIFDSFARLPLDCP
jgi:hypothetical protein